MIPGSPRSNAKQVRDNTDALLDKSRPFAHRVVGWLYDSKYTVFAVGILVGFVAYGTWKALT